MCMMVYGMYESKGKKERVGEVVVGGLSGSQVPGGGNEGMDAEVHDRALAAWHGGTTGSVAWWQLPACQAHLAPLVQPCLGQDGGR